VKCQGQVWNVLYASVNTKGVTDWQDCSVCAYFTDSLLRIGLLKKERDSAHSTKTTFDNRIADICGSLNCKCSVSLMIIVLKFFRTEHGFIEKYH